MSQVKIKYVVGHKKNITVDIETVHEIATSPNLYVISLAKDSIVKIKQSRSLVLDICKDDQAVYGINTGFGALSNKFISSDQLEELQYNIIRSHCTGVGEPFSDKIIRAIIFIRIHSFAQGYSGISLELVNTLISFLNFNIIPIVPNKGSVGASGDLAPLAHLSLALIGEGPVKYKDKIYSQSKILFKKLGLKLPRLGPKDGLALINSTAVMAAMGVIAWSESFKIFRQWEISAALSLDSVQGSLSPFHLKIHLLKAHPGQIRTAKKIKQFLKNSSLNQSHKNCDRVQDAYSLRCIPQVFGAVYQTLEHSKNIIEIEINSVTDNPLVFQEDSMVISGGNFHGEAIAMALDYLTLGMSELGSISERRIEKMMNPLFSSLPPFLIKNGGLNSGLMMAQVTAAALASENKINCFPASADSIPTSTDKEDHVSMGINSGAKLFLVIENLKHILSIEFLCGFQALWLLRPNKSSPFIEDVWAHIGKKIKPIEKDRNFSLDFISLKKMIEDSDFISIQKKHFKDNL